MFAILSAWFDLCLLRRAPQDMPASGLLLTIAIICYTATSALANLLGWGRIQAIPVALLDVSLLLAFVFVLLYLQGKLARVMQTLSALYGAGTLVGLATIPLLLPGWQSGEVPVVAQFFMVALFGWNLVIVAHIMRHAMSSSFATGIAVSVLYSLVSMQVVITVFPVT
jgi:hypothetical protein